jgi:hypothetical protein
MLAAVDVHDVCHAVVVGVILSGDDFGAARIAHEYVCHVIFYGGHEA